MIDSLRKGSSLTRKLLRMLKGEVPVWRAHADNARFQVWSGDHFIEEPGQKAVYLIRRIPWEYFQEARQDVPGCIQTTSPPDQRLRLL
jgi:hypothetical protein